LFDGCLMPPPIDPCKNLPRSLIPDEAVKLIDIGTIFSFGKPASPRKRGANTVTTSASGSSKPRPR